MLALGCHLAAFFYAAAAGGRAGLAVFVIVSTALLGTPLADVSAEAADLASKFAVPRHRLGAQQTDVDAFAAAVRTIIVAFHVDHRSEAHFACGRALLTRLDTTLMFHGGFLGESKDDHAMRPERRPRRLHSPRTHALQMQSTDACGKCYAKDGTTRAVAGQCRVCERIPSLALGSYEQDQRLAGC
jgi:hypothetical protein